MASGWTGERIAAIAPDEASLKAGRSLAARAKWSATGRSDLAAWGQIQGSGSSPYGVQVTLDGSAFKCSCPSRKQPCKHALGMLLLLVEAEDAFPPAEPPASVATWLESRRQREEKAAARSPEAKPADPVAREKRAAARAQKVAAGVEEGRLWLRDVVRQGLASLESQTRAYWERTAARMVDAQAPGLARRIREMASIAGSGPDWQGRLLRRMASMHLLLEAHGRLPALPPGLQSDVMTQLGHAQPAEEILAGAGIADEWTVLSRSVEEEDGLRVQRTWLRGASAGRFALLLEFAAGQRPFAGSLHPGQRLRATVFYYASAYPLRGLLGQPEMIGDGAPPGGGNGIDSALSAFAAALGSCPWIERFPFRLGAVTPELNDGRWTLRDAEGRRIELGGAMSDRWKLLALSGGRPLDLFGEWDGERLVPLGAGQ